MLKNELYKFIELSDNDDGRDDYNIPKRQAPWDNKDSEKYQKKKHKLPLVDIEIDVDTESIYKEFIFSENTPPSENKLANNDNDSGDSSMSFIQKTNLRSTNPKISNFIKFCVKKRLFDDTFYDYGNVFSIVATKLPETFNVVSDGREKITMIKFKSSFKNTFKYRGNIGYIYGQIDKDKKGFLTWDEFKDFFLPFVKNITV